MWGRSQPSVYLKLLSNARMLQICSATVLVAFVIGLSLGSMNWLNVHSSERAVRSFSSGTAAHKNEIGVSENIEIASPASQDHPFGKQNSPEAVGIRSAPQNTKIEPPAPTKKHEDLLEDISGANGKDAGADALEGMHSNETMASTSSTEKPKVVFFIPWSGNRWINYIDYFIVSCHHNREFFDWVIIYDSNRIRLPASAKFSTNVKFIKVPSIPQLFVERLSGIFNVSTSSLSYYIQTMADSPWLYHTFRALYGALFPDFTKGYSHWYVAIQTRSVLPSQISHFE
jgi:hypothetical protein